MHKKVYLLQPGKPLETITVKSAGLKKKQRIKKTKVIDGEHYVGRPFSPQSRLQLEFSYQAHVAMESIFGFIPRMKIVPEQAMFLLADDYRRIGKMLTDLELENLINLSWQKVIDGEEFSCKLSELTLENLHEFLPAYVRFVMWMNLSGYLNDAWDEWIEKVLREYKVDDQRRTHLYEGRTPLTEKSKKQNMLAHIVETVLKNSAVKRKFQQTEDMDSLQRWLRDNNSLLYEEIGSFSERYKFQPNNWTLPAPLKQVLTLIQEYVKQNEVPRKSVIKSRNQMLWQGLFLSDEQRDHVERMFETHAQVIYWDNSDNELKARADNRLKRIFSDVRQRYNMNEEKFFSQSFKALESLIGQTLQDKQQEFDTPQKHIITFDDERMKDSRLVGEKSYNLAEMKGIPGVNVPDGFVVSTTAFDLFLRENFINTSLLGEKIRQALQKAFLPKEVEQEVRQAYRYLRKRNGGKNIKVVVRSSGNAEDRPGLSFSNQYDSFLDKEGEDAVVAAVKEVWVSLYSKRALSYLKKKWYR